MKKLLTIMVLALALCLLCGMALADSSKYPGVYTDIGDAEWQLTVDPGDYKVGDAELDHAATNAAFVYGSDLWKKIDAHTSTQNSIEWKLPNVAGDALITITVGTHMYGPDESTRIKPTCTSDGSVVMKCSCGLSYTQTLKALGHAEAIATDPENIACGAKYKKLLTCGRCGATLGETTEEYTAPGHDFTAAPADWAAALADANLKYFVFKDGKLPICKPGKPTCTFTEATLYTEACKKCQTVKDGSAKIEGITVAMYEAYLKVFDAKATYDGHNWDAWKDDPENPATCYSPAGQTRTCARCNTLQIKAPADNLGGALKSFDPVVTIEATCADLWSDPIPATAWVYGGWDFYSLPMITVTCKNCDNPNHNFTVTLHEGWDWDTFKANQQKLFNENKAVIFSVDKVLEKKKWNDAKDAIIADTDIEKTFTIRIDHGAFVNVPGAFVTLNLDGSLYADHFNWDQYNPQPCETQKGTVSACSVCGAGFSFAAAGNVKKHAMSAWEQTYEGMKPEFNQWTRHCTNDGCTYKEIVTAKTPPTECELGNHPADKKVEIAAVASTCTTKGHKAGVKCGECGKTLEGLEELELDPTAHTIDPEKCEVLKAATCKEAGVALGLCTECNAPVKVDLPKLEGDEVHTWKEIERKEPTNKEAGYIKYKCDVCEAEKTEELAIVLDKAAYKLENVEFKDGLLTGKLTHVDGSEEAAAKGIRVTFFHSDNTYVTVAAQLYADGTFEAEGAGSVEHITVAAYGVEKVVNPDNLTEENWFGSARVDVK